MSKRETRETVSTPQIFGAASRDWLGRGSETRAILRNRENTMTRFHVSSSISKHSHEDVTAMAKVTRKEWYRRVNAAWPATVPTLTADEASRAARRLYRFVTKRTWRGAVVVTSGNRRLKFRAGRIVVNPDHGWHALVHELSHWLESYAGTHGHTAAHARLELRMIKEVVRRGWLDGKLTTPVRDVAPPPEMTDKRAEKLARTLAAIDRWEKKQRRAENALRKLHRRRRGLERAVERAALAVAA